MKKKSDVRAIAPKIRNTAAEWYEGFFPTLNAGATWTLENFPSLYLATLAEMRGKFTAGELKMFIDVMNGTTALMTYGGAGLAGQHIGLSIMDSFELHPGVYEDKWGAEKTLNGKLAGCTRFQLVCLEIWAGGFWEGDYQAEDAVEDHLKILV